MAGVVMTMSAFTFTSSINWKISDGYSVKFAGTDAEGVFKTLNGDVVFDEANVEASKFSFTVDVNSINTGNGMKNKHAVSPKWFDAEQFPTISFNSSKVAKGASGYEVTGTMKIHGITKEMTPRLKLKPVNLQNTLNVLNNS